MARMRITLVAATATIAAFAAPTTALAVTTTCGGLQAALDDDANTEVILAEGEECSNHFNLPSREIALAGGGSGATLRGESKGSFQILSGDSVGRTTIKNLTFIGGEADESEGDDSDNSGGAIQLTGFSPVTIENNEFFGNSASANGGAVSIESFQVFTVDARGDANPPVVLRGNTFGGTAKDDGNHAQREGGAAYVSAFFHPVIVEDNTFTANVTSDGDGGGLQVDAAQTLTLAGNTFEGNLSGEDGGGAAASICSAEVTDNVFDGNLSASIESSLAGGGLHLNGSRCREQDVVRGGTGSDVTQSGNLFVDNEIEGRFSSGEGGGEFIEDLSVVSTNDSFVGNAITVGNSGSGGGLGYRGDALPFAARNLVAAGNAIVPSQEQPPSRGVVDQGRGGGLSLIGDGSNEFRIEDSTIETNTAAAGSGIAGQQQRSGLTRAVAQADTLRVANSIVFGNTGASEEIGGFDVRDVRSTDTCVGGAPHEDGDGAAPNSNVCVDPQLTEPDTDGNVDQTDESPTLDAGNNALVDSDLAQDYAGDGRVLDGDGDGTARVDMGADEAKAVTAEPTPEPEPTVQPPPAAQPAPPQGAVQGQTQRSCKSKRVFRIRIRVPRGKKARSATVRVNNRKVKVVRGKRLKAPVLLRGLPKGRFTVRITVRLTNGKKITGKRTYHTCIPKLPGDGPPRV